MTFSLFVPPGAPAPVLLFLSGLTCTDANFCEKAGAFAAAAAARVAILVTDTSPRGEPATLGVPPPSETSWDLGLGAGFYIDATSAPWAAHWRMESYVARELPALLSSDPALAASVDASRLAVFGHSMGGFGALSLALKHPGLFRSASAFAPIAHPSACAWGRKAFGAYLGADAAAWAAHDPTALVSTPAGAAAARAAHLKIDMGSADEFLAKGQLLPEDFLAACSAAGVDVDYALRDGYDHSYYFIATFVSDHIAHAAHYLHAP